MCIGICEAVLKSLTSLFMSSYREFYVALRSSISSALLDCGGGCCGGKFQLFLVKNHYCTPYTYLSAVVLLSISQQNCFIHLGSWYRRGNQLNQQLLHCSLHLYVTTSHTSVFSRGLGLQIVTIYFYIHIMKSCSAFRQQ